MSTLASDHASKMICAGTLDELRQRGCRVVHGSDRPIAVFYNGGQPQAVDNRCPHMGFPLHKGTCEDGIITCHWHHARFDASSGCTFDPFADDVPAYDVVVRAEEVFVAAEPRGHDSLAHGRRRLRDGMRQNVALVCAKAILSLRSAGMDEAAIAREAALFGVQHRDGWSMGLTVLSAVANVRHDLDEPTGYLALYQSVRRVAADCSGQPARVTRSPLEGARVNLEMLSRWLNHWTLVRHRDGAERTILTAIEQGATLAQLNQLIFTAATQRYFAAGGHLIDFCNKAFELLELIGEQHAPAVLPSVVEQLVNARGGEESNSWRHPVDLVPLVHDATASLDPWFAQGTGKTYSDEDTLAQNILGDDPRAVLQAIGKAIGQGATPAQLAQALAYAAAMRVARFGTANEIGDWVTALHTFSYCNALHRAITRSRDATPLVPGVLHGAMSVYLDRFLNMPPAKLPGERGRPGGAGGASDDLPIDPSELLTAFHHALDQPQRVDLAARLVDRYLAMGHPTKPLLDALGLAAVREDADFHTIQMVEAGIGQWRLWGDDEHGRRILIAVARYLAAHSPTPRSQRQAADIALRLHRGERIYETDEGEQ